MSDDTNDERFAIYFSQEGSIALKMAYINPSRINRTDLCILAREKLGMVSTDAPLTITVDDGDQSPVEIDDDDSLDWALSTMRQQEAARKKNTENNSPSRMPRKIPFHCRKQPGLPQPPSASPPRKMPPPLLASASASATATDVSSQQGLSPDMLLNPVSTWTAKSKSAALYDCAFGPGGDHFAAVSRAGTINVWSVNHELPLSTFTSRQSGEFILCCDFSPSNPTLIAAGGTGSTVYLWDYTNKDHVTKAKGHSDKVYSCAFSADGRHLVSGGTDKQLRTFDVATAKSTSSMDFAASVFMCEPAHADWNRTVVGTDSLGSRASVSVVDLRAKDVATEFMSSKNETIWSVSFSQADHLISSTSMSGKVSLYDVTAGKLRQEFEYGGPVHSALFSLDDRFLFACGRDWKIHVYDVLQGCELGAVAAHQNTVYRMDIHDSRLLTVSLDESVALWHMGPALFADEMK